MRCCVRILLLSMLLVLPAAGVFALKVPEPGNAVQPSAPTPAETSTSTPDKKPVAEKTLVPARPTSPERVQADSAVSFPVDI